MQQPYGLENTNVEYKYSKYSATSFMSEHIPRFHIIEVKHTCFIKLSIINSKYKEAESRDHKPYFAKEAGILRKKLAAKCHYSLFTIINRNIPPLA